MNNTQSFPTNPDIHKSWGQWTCEIEGRGQIITHIVQSGTFLLCIKETNIGGYVKEGDPMWELNLDTLECRPYIAEENGEGLKTICGELIVLSQDRIKVRWFFPTEDRIDEVIFRRFDL